MMHQLPLNIQRNDSATFDNFYWENNDLVAKQLQLAVQNMGERLVYLWGSPSSGKSHLLQACCQALHPTTVSYLPLSLLLSCGPEIFDGLDEQALVSIDDLDTIAGKIEWEIALFHLYNRIRDSNGLLILAATCPPLQLPLHLPDLKSRLCWGLILQINPLSDEGKVKMLQLHAKKRGFDLPDNVGHFLIQRCTRTLPELLSLLNELDTASLIAQRKITIPFVKSILKDA